MDLAADIEVVALPALGRQLLRSEMTQLISALQPTQVRCLPVCAGIGKNVAGRALWKAEKDGKSPIDRRLTYA